MIPTGQRPLRRLLAFFRKDPLDAELEDEIAAHLNRTGLRTKDHANSEFLKQSLLGNTHSVSNRYASRRPTTFDASFDYLFVSSSKLSTGCADEAREAVLSFFRAPPGYTVVFTANATGALKLVGEAYPFTEESTYVLGVDSHNSVHGIREFARRAGARVCYIESTSQGGFDLAEAKVKKAQ